MRLCILFGVLVTGCVPVLTSPDGGVDAGPWVAPENTWPMGAPPDGLTATTITTGEVVPEFRLADQYGDTVSLWQFYGMVVIVDISTGWCGPCQQLAAEAQAMADDYRDQGLEYVTVMPQDAQYNIPETDDLNDWGDAFGLAEPILADDAGWSAQALPNDDFPGVFLVNREMKLVGRIEPTTDETIRAAIEGEL